MKDKRKLQQRANPRYNIRWIVYGFIILLIVYVFVSPSPQHFTIQSNMIPTAQYLLEHPKTGIFQLVVTQVSEEYDYLYDVCIDMGYGALNYGDNRRIGSILIDRERPLSLSESTVGWTIFRCARGVYLEKGLHLIEYQSEDEIFYQKWAMEVE